MRKKILLVEPYFSGSHQQWAESLCQYSTHDIRLLTLRGKYWKWRMYGGAVALAKRFCETAHEWQPDLVLASDMLDAATFMGLARRQLQGVPLAIYFHENQLTYPWSPTDDDLATDNASQYAFINYTSALAADVIFFNSDHHRQSFLGALPNFLRRFPDVRGLDNLPSLQAKSQTLHLGLDLRRFDALRMQAQHTNAPYAEAVILWNHRWEYDKNPDMFFEILFRLDAEGIPFKLVVLGKHYARSPDIFLHAKRQLAHRLLHFDYVNDINEYMAWLCVADVVFVTNKQDFFGASVVEAIYSGCLPILPRRLSYPELLPSSVHEYYIYDNDEMAYQMLKNVLSDPQKLRQAKNDFSQMVARFDWSVLAKRYDEALSAVAR